MFKYRFFAIFAALLLLAVPANAGWDVVPGSGEGDCSFDKGYSICFADFSSTSTSGIMNTNICENYTAHWISNIASQAHANTIVIRWSIAATESVNTSEIANNTTLTGDPATGLDVLAGYDAPWIYASATMSSGTGRLAVQCFKRRW